MLQIHQSVPHGLDFYDGSFWVIDGADRLVQRLDPENGRVQEVWPFGPNDPDPHGMCVYNNHVYFTDAGLGGGRKPSAGTEAADDLPVSADEDVAGGSWSGGWSTELYS